MPENADKKPATPIPNCFRFGRMLGKTKQEFLQLKKMLAEGQCNPELPCFECFLSPTCEKRKVWKLSGCQAGIRSLRK